ncbi:MAG: DUF4124 domain-containing protein [Xanthomonadaceae bacterium]|nr:DUF4124 domain-containing protein [Xanthomonadaceae bacterium]
MRTFRPLALALLLPLLAAPVLAQQQQRVYQWKDASGVTHYADTKPAQNYKSRDIDVRTGTTAGATAAKAEDSEQCINARNNLARLQGSEAVGIDTNGDGKPDRNLTDAERKSQRDLNEAGVKAFCTPAKS